MMLTLAFVAGFLWDTQHYLGPQGGDPAIYQYSVPNMRFGYSILLYGFMGMLMQSIQPLFRRGIWQVSALLSGVSIALYLSIEFLLIAFVRGSYQLPLEVLHKIWISSTLTMIASPIIFALLFYLAKYSNHTIRYDGLRKRYFTPEPPIE